jgi:hypothetical protein
LPVSSVAGVWGTPHYGTAEQRKKLVALNSGTGRGTLS